MSTFSETRLTVLTITSVLSHWLTVKPLFFHYVILRQHRMVGWLVNSTATDISLRHSCTFYLTPHVLKDDFQSVLRTLESLFAVFVLFHVRHHKM